MIYINLQLEGKKDVQVIQENFPRLFDGAHRIRDISIIETPNGIDVQTVLAGGEIKKSIAEFLRRTYQARHN